MFTASGCITQWIQICCRKIVKNEFRHQRKNIQLWFRIMDKVQPIGLSLKKVHHECKLQHFNIEQFGRDTWKANLY